MADAPMKPRISVVIPAYNVERHIGETVASVLAQTLREFELIVVDDGSSDGTAAEIRRFADPRLRAITKSNGGVSAARNTGLAACSAPLVVFLDGDDLLTPGALEIMCETMDRAPEAVACCGQHEKISEDGEPLSDNAKTRIQLSGTCDTLSQLIKGNLIVNGGTLCMRVSAAKRAGGFDTSLRLGEDWEFWCRLALLGDFRPIPDFTAMKYRQRIAGANVRLTGSGIRPNFEAVEKIFANREIAARFPPPLVAEAFRNARKMVFWTAARNKMMAGDWLAFLQYAVVGAVRYPPSIAQLQSVKRYLVSLWTILRAGAGARSNGL
jgi:glycosyltransferase involved in cell wall biosynthesis